MLEPYYSPFGRFVNAQNGDEPPVRNVVATLGREVVLGRN